jgi:hypothetical protein
MTGRQLVEKAQQLAALAAQRKADEYEETPWGMRATAAELRLGAAGMVDTFDRDLMLRLAAAFEQRATDALRRSKHVQRHLD